MSDAPDRNPRHSDDTGGEDMILVEFTAEMVPHDSPEFRGRARLAAERPIPDYLKPEPEGRNPPSGT